MFRIVKRAAAVLAVLLALTTMFPAVSSAQTRTTCRTFEATSEVAWFLSEDEPAVDVYPTGLETLQPYFEYKCAPRNTSVVTIFTLDGEEIYSDEEVLQPSSRPDIYTYPLSAKEGPVPDGEWGVTFLVNDEPVATGTIVVGGSDSGEEQTEQAEAVEVGGTVTDKRTKKPIKDALFIVLNPGVTIEQFREDDFAEEHVYTAASTDARGEFVLDQLLEREVEYSILVVAKGYQPIAQDGFFISAEDESPLYLNVTLSK